MKNTISNKKVLNKRFEVIRNTLHIHYLKATKKLQITSRLRAKKLDQKRVGSNGETGSYVIELEDISTWATLIYKNSNERNKDYNKLQRILMKGGV